MYQPKKRPMPYIFQIIQHEVIRVLSRAMIKILDKYNINYVSAINSEEYATIEIINIEKCAIFVNMNVYCFYLKPVHQKYVKSSELLNTYLHNLNYQLMFFSVLSSKVLINFRKGDLELRHYF